MTFFSPSAIALRHLHKMGIYCRFWAAVVICALLFTQRPGNNSLLLEAAKWRIWNDRSTRGPLLWQQHFFGSPQNYISPIYFEDSGSVEASMNLHGDMLSQSSNTGLLFIYSQGIHSRLLAGGTCMLRAQNQHDAIQLPTFACCKLPLHIGYLRETQGKLLA